MLLPEMHFSYNSVLHLGWKRFRQILATPLFVNYAPWFPNNNHSNSNSNNNNNNVMTSKRGSQFLFFCFK